MSTSGRGHWLSRKLYHSPAFTWATTAAGLALLWQAVRRGGVPLSTRTLVGAMALGWGLFNLVEGVIDHHLLHLHHVTETEGHLVWDLLFLASGVVLVLVGWTLIRAARGDAATAAGGAEPS